MGLSANVRILLSSLPAICPLITPCPEELTVSSSSPMKTTAPVTTACSCEEDAACLKPKTTLNSGIGAGREALLDGESLRESVNGQKSCRRNHKEELLPPEGVPVPVQSEATPYVPLRDPVTITPSMDAVVSPLNVPVVESNVSWLTAAVARVPLLSVPSCRNP